MRKLNERPGSQDTNTSTHTASTTGHPSHTRRHPQHSQALSRRGCQVPRGRSAELPTADRLTRHQECPKRRKSSSLLPTRNSQQTAFEIRRLVSRLLETDELWPTHERNAPQTCHPRQHRRCGRFSRFYPWLAAKPVCSPPTAAVEWPFGDSDFGAVCARIKNPHPSMKTGETA